MSGPSNVAANAPPLTIPAALYAQLRAHGEETEVASLLRAGNTRTDAAHNRYHIDPRELIAAQREGRRLGLDIVGFYHSHPDHPAQWSQTDFAEAHWFGCSYVITAVEGDKQAGTAMITNSFLLTGTGEDDKAFVPQPVRVA